MLGKTTLGETTLGKTTLGKTTLGKTTLGEPALCLDFDSNHVVTIPVRHAYSGTPI
jgi:hypothetical protein